MCRWKTVCQAAGSQRVQQVDPVAAERVAHAQRQPLGRRDGVREVLVRRVVEVPRVVARDHERVAARPRVDVHERDRVLVLLDDLGGQLARHDLAEDAVVGHGRAAYSQPDAPEAAVQDGADACAIRRERAPGSRAPTAAPACARSSCRRCRRSRSARRRSRPRRRSCARPRSGARPPARGSPGATLVSRSRSASSWSRDADQVVVHVAEVGRGPPGGSCT